MVPCWLEMLLLPLPDALSSRLLAVSAIEEALFRRRFVARAFGISFPSPLELLSMVGSAIDCRKSGEEQVAEPGILGLGASLTTAL